MVAEPDHHDIAPVRIAYLTTAASTRDLIAHDDVGRRWEEPSALDQMSIGELAAHLARAVFTVETYLEQPAQPGAPGITAADYFWSVIGDGSYSGIDSKLQTSVRSRATTDSKDGHEALAGRVADSLTGVRDRLADPDTPSTIEVLGDMVMTVDEYLVTRIVEMVVHMDDLATSIDGEPDRVDPLAERLAAGTLADLAVRRHGITAVARSLTRTERAPESIAVF